GLGQASRRPLRAYCHKCVTKPSLNCQIHLLTSYLLLRKTTFTGRDTMNKMLAAFVATLSLMSACNAAFAGSKTTPGTCTAGPNGGGGQPFYYDILAYNVIYDGESDWQLAAEAQQLCNSDPRVGGATAHVVSYTVLA